MIEHVSLICSDSRKSRDFFEKALAPIGYEQDWVYGKDFAFKHRGRHDFWVSQGRVGTPTHVAFNCKTRAMVRRFYEAAIAAGGKNNGHPRLRPENGPNYYAAYVLDRDGHNIEAVSFAGPAKKQTTRKKKSPPRPRRA